MNNAFQRFIELYGIENYKKIKHSTVLVLGLGGVGGYVVESIVRCGVGTVILVDNDTVDVTNINRQLIANYDTIGMKKTDCFKERIKSINPKCNVKTITKFINEDNYLELFKEKIDFIVDAIDSVKTKEIVIKYALENDIRIISSMGTGNRENPSDLRIMDISKTTGDPIARLIRKYLRDNKISKKLPVLCSLELPMKKIDKIIPSNSFVPSSAGLLIGSYVIKELMKN
ncbi:MAG: tRNA threonylcarbamoyladenosine dehydratase [Bacilli bacterium]|nr:tRNA threonylcarbamoyladenosine dehydratase [Bacilli bacterium]